VNACLFTNNQVLGFNGSGEGGAIDDDGTMSVASSTFTGNQAIGANGAVIGNGHGGGIGVDGTLSVTDCTFRGNQALLASARKNDAPCPHGARGISARSTTPRGVPALSGDGDS
jgi:hypothetical protein